MEIECDAGRQARRPYGPAHSDVHIGAPLAKARQRVDAILGAFARIVVVEHQHGVRDRLTLWKKQSRIDAEGHDVVYPASETSVEHVSDRLRKGDAVKGQVIRTADAIFRPGARFVMEEDL